ncbi:MAG: hypothetical protein ABIJ56_15685 [Pseudomonadota bacterium]
MKIIMVGIVLFGLTLFAFAARAVEDPCAGITCPGQVECRVVEGVAVCIIPPGFPAAGLIDKPDGTAKGKKKKPKSPQKKQCKNSSQCPEALLCFCGQCVTQGKHDELVEARESYVHGSGLMALGTVLNALGYGLTIGVTAATPFSSHIYQASVSSIYFIQGAQVQALNQLRDLGVEPPKNLLRLHGAGWVLLGLAMLSVIAPYYMAQRAEEGTVDAHDYSLVLFLGALPLGMASVWVSTAGFNEISKAVKDEQEMRIYRECEGPRVSILPALTPLENGAALGLAGVF